MPWEKVEKRYDFEGPGGKASLADLFGKRGPLIVYHFMLRAGLERGLPELLVCSSGFDGMTRIFANRDVTFVVVSHAPLAEIEAFKKRMGWKFNWYSSDGSNFNYDYQVSLKPEEGRVGLLQLRDGGIPRHRAPASSVFLRDARPARCFTRTPRMPAGSTFW